MALRPELKVALARLAKIWAQQGRDPVEMIQWLIQVVKWRDEVYLKMTPGEQAMVRRHLKQLRER